MKACGRGYNISKKSKLGQCSWTIERKWRITLSQTINAEPLMIKINRCITYQKFI